MVGRTGSGKTTLLRTLNGLVPHFSGGTLHGRVVVDGRDTRDHRPRDLADVVGYVGQDPLAGFVTDTVEDELAYGMESLGPRAGRDAQARRGDPRPARPRRRAQPSGGRPVRRPAAARRDRLGADHAPAGAGARRAHLRAGPARRRGGARHPAAAGARPRPDRRARRAPARAGRAVRRPGGPRARRRPRRSSPARPSRCSATPRSRRRSSSSAGSPAGTRCRCRCATPGGSPPRCASGSPGVEAPGDRRTPDRGRDRRHRRGPGGVLRPGARAAGRHHPARPRRGGRADGPQRRRQVHAAQDAGRHEAADAAAGSLVDGLDPADAAPVRAAAARRDGAAGAGRPALRRLRRPGVRAGRPGRPGARRAPRWRCSGGSPPASPSSSTRATCPRASG